MYAWQFFVCLFNDAISNSEHVASCYSMTVNNELEKLWKEASIAGFKTLSWIFSGETEEDHEQYR
jgi:hypothetical protein